MAIDAISAYSSAGKALLTPAAPAAGPAGKGGSTTADRFTDSLNGLLASVDQTAGEANTAIANMVSGTGDVHDAMIALQRAETTLQLTVQVRNKLVQAYQDVMRMPI
jgi:flagellar hook-basal body complex protein FliE